VASVPVPLDEASLRAHFVGRPAYRHTRYIVAQAAGAAGAGGWQACGPQPGRPRVGGSQPGGAHLDGSRADGSHAGAASAVVEVTKRSDGPLFSEITAAQLIAGPDETAFVEAPEADTGIPTILGRIAAERAPGARCVVVRGRYGHVGFIVGPAPVRIRVVEVVPPQPAKLVDQASRVLELAEDLPPVELAPELTDLGVLAGSSPAGHYLFPCRAGAATGPAAAGAAGARRAAAGAAGAGPADAATRDAPASDAPAPDAKVSYLDEIPPRADWTLVGCARSRAIHDWFYDDAAPVVDMCPRNLARQAAAEGTLPVLTKCCLLEEKIVVEDGLVVVPWGASLAQVREGLARAVAIASAAQPAPL
jgi:hypothetical protein